ncbi:hypothetical protein IRY61_01355 [Candidatus Saccharibacteria bacterium]|nr:hypothetical protein [Candidatus Saccharibacteria bacterium]
MRDDLSTYEIMGAMGLVGIIAAIGQLLASKEKLTARIVIGRVLSTTALAMSAGGLMLWFADPHPLALIGTSAALASLGTSFLERLVQRKVFGIK